MAGHIVQRMADTTGADGGPAGAHNWSMTAYPFGQTHLRQLTWPEPQGSRTEQYQNNDLLKQMTVLCATVQSLGQQMQDVQSLGEQMQEGFATESFRRQEDFWNMKETMTAKMEEFFRSEQLAREQAHNEIKQMVRKDLGVMKEMKNLKMGSRSTVCSEASTGESLGSSGTFARPPALASQYSEIFIPKKMEFKGWVTDPKSVVSTGSRPRRSRISSEICKRWFRMNFTRKLTGIKPGQSKVLGRPRLWSVVGSIKKPIWQR